VSDDVLLSVVAPVYGCADCLLALHSRLTNGVKQIADRYEFVFVDDRGVADGWAVLVALAREGGVVGPYVGRIFEQVKNRPLFLIDQQAAGAEPRLPTALTPARARRNRERPQNPLAVARHQGLERLLSESLTVAADARVGGVSAEAADQRQVTRGELRTGSDTITRSRDAASIASRIRSGSGRKW